MPKQKYSPCCPILYQYSIFFAKCVSHESLISVSSSSAYFLSRSSSQGVQPPHPQPSAQAHFWGPPHPQRQIWLTGSWIDPYIVFVINFCVRRKRKVNLCRRRYVRICVRVYVYFLFGRLSLRPFIGWHSGGIKHCHKKAENAQHSA
ncbi:hypothetical protein FPQ18DRAFT_336162 [Pyronema domesticum]|nr:hypothetical protein FPQ18DRAFT_336162 [Pyronema domesticum]